MEESDGLMISELCKNLSQLPLLSNLQRFKISPFDPLFDLVAFGDFIITNSDAEFYLQYTILSKDQEITVARKERILHQHLPSTCKLFIAF